MNEKTENQLLKFIENNSKVAIALTLLIVFGATFLAFYTYNSTFSWFKPPANRGEWGAMGDFFGGVLNPLLTFFTMVLLIYSLALQQRELANSAKSASETAKNNLEQEKIAKESFELQVDESKQQRVLTEKLIAANEKQASATEEQIRLMQQSAHEEHIFKRIEQSEKVIERCLDSKIYGDKCLIGFSKAELFHNLSEGSLDEKIKYLSSRIETQLIIKVNLITNLITNSSEKIKNHHIGYSYLNSMFDEITDFHHDKGYFIGESTKVKELLSTLEFLKTYQDKFNFQQGVIPELKELIKLINSNNTAEEMNNLTTKYTSVMDLNF
ncbi:hypothetical protein PTRA_a2506 [Pseudoalteromonas translucida KMM 520]|uniref:Phage abortive infection protein n=1 Tax=Pseudoalteromonas translucida KMM 520 TaxID=1315283 RepID=A0A0U2MQN5_9GAMM|nr:hypothetical protein [Pseudoalteromonas translucida]ALS33588.1 hypothetical protein PTRA_a2506 [Pseudoalteromonas translucida KMM 520]